MKKQFVKRIIALLMSITLVLMSCVFGAPILFYDGNYGGKACYVLRGIHSGHNSNTGILYFSPYKNIVVELGITCTTSWY